MRSVKLAACVCATMAFPTIVAAQQPQSPDASRDKIVNAVTSFADALWPKGSPENLMGVRSDLNAASAAAPTAEPEPAGRGLRVASIPPTSLVERDPQYRENAE